MFFIRWLVFTAVIVVLTGLSTKTIAAIERRYETAASQPTVVSPNGRAKKLYTNSNALLISVESYSGIGAGGWRRLNHAHREMNQIRDVLLKHGFGVTRLEDPNSQELMTAVRQFIAKYGREKESRLIIMFSGHGYTNPNNKVGYIVPRDAKNPSVDADAFYAAAISIQHVNIWAAEIESKHAMFIFDSCFSGSVFGTRNEPATVVKRTEENRWGFFTGSAAEPVRQVIAAGGEKEILPDESVFVPMFLQAIRHGTGANNDGFVTGREVGTWIEQGLPGRTNKSQNPHFDLVTGTKYTLGDMIFQLPTLEAAKDSAPEVVNLRSQASVAVAIAPKKSEDVMSVPIAAPEKVIAEPANACLNFSKIQVLEIRQNQRLELDLKNWLKVPDACNILAFLRKAPNDGKLTVSGDWVMFEPDLSGVFQFELVLRIDDGRVSMNVPLNVSVRVYPIVAGGPITSIR